MSEKLSCRIHAEDIRNAGLKVKIKDGHLLVKGKRNEQTSRLLVKILKAFADL